MTYSLLKEFKAMKYFFVLCCFLGIIGPASAQFTTPLYIAPEGEIEDEFGRLLSGTAVSPGDHVVVYEALNGVIYPPSVVGSPHSDNVPVSGGVTGIGHLAPVAHPQPGFFNLAISGGQRPGNNKKLFVRVFNASDPASSSFYGDSQLFTVSNNKPFKAIVRKTDQPLDSGDDDEDGLHNSYEKSLGTSSEKYDSDGDGMSDYAEFSAGTDGTNEESFLALSGLSIEGSDLLLRWLSISGKTYQAETSLDLTDPDFDEVGSLFTADGTLSTLRIDGELTKPGSHYRIRVINP